MENAYGIGITNKFAVFLDEDSDPLDILKQGELAQNKKIEAATKPAAKAPAKTNKNDADKENNQRNNRFEGKKVFDARKASDGPREERNNQRNRDGGEMRRDDDGERRGAGRGGGRGRGGPGRGRGGPGGPGGRGGKREFDRKSGDSRTGIKPEEKKEGRGKANWGNYEDDTKEDSANLSVEEAPGQEGEPKEGGEGGSDKEQVPEEPKTLTLDEWKALNSKKAGPKFNLRKAGEGQKDDPKWKKATAYKKENPEDESEEEDDDDNEVIQQASARRKKITDINFTFADESRGGGMGRGRGRGGRGRGDRERGERGDRGDDRGDRRGERGDRGDDRGDRRGERGDRGNDRGDRRGGPRGGRGGGDRAPRGGKKEFVLQQEAFPTLG